MSSCPWRKAKNRTTANCPRPWVNAERGGQTREETRGAPSHRPRPASEASAPRAAWAAHFTTYCWREWAKDTTHGHPLSRTPDPAPAVPRPVEGVALSRGDSAAEDRPPVPGPDGRRLRGSVRGPTASTNGAVHVPLRLPRPSHRPAVRRPLPRLRTLGAPQHLRQRSDRHRSGETRFCSVRTASPLLPGYHMPYRTPACLRFQIFRSWSSFDRWLHRVPTDDGMTRSGATESSPGARLDDPDQSTSCPSVAASRTSSSVSRVWVGARAVYRQLRPSGGRSA